MKGYKHSRENLGKISSIIGVFANIILAVGKIIIGLMFGFISVLADGLNNLSDCGSSVLSFVSFKMSSKPADKEHPYGHERIEYISSMIVAFIILILAFELAKESLQKIIFPQALAFSLVVVAVLVLSILVKGGMFVYFNLMSKKINSDILKATALDSLTDCISTSAVLISIIISQLFGVNIDGYAGILVSLFIAWSGFKILKETISKLIGQAPDKELISSIKQRILKRSEVLGIHDLNVYCYGPNKYFASVHIELDAAIDALSAHELIDDIEREFAQQTNVALTGHHDPIVVDDEEVNAMREAVSKIVKNLDSSFSMHDFRMVKGVAKTNLIFEIAVPFETKISDEEITEYTKAEIAKIDKKYNPVIMVEKQMF